jgi:hypothetical protein
MGSGKTLSRCLFLCKFGGFIFEGHSGRFAPLGNAGILRFAQNDNNSDCNDKSRSPSGMTSKKCNRNGQSWRGRCYIPTHRYGAAMDGAPDLWWVVEENKEREGKTKARYRDLSAAAAFAAFGRDDVVGEELELGKRQKAKGKSNGNGNGNDKDNDKSWLGRGIHSHPSR